MAMVVSGSCRAAARGLQWGASWAERRFLGAAGGARLGCWRQRALSGQRRGRGGSQCSIPNNVPSLWLLFSQPLLCGVFGAIGPVYLQVLEEMIDFSVFGKSRLLRGLAFSALSYLGYEAYVLLSPSALVHADAQVEEILDQADYLYGSGETEKLYQLLEQHKNSENAELLWRLARASRDLAQLSHTSAEKKKQLTYEALNYAKKALGKDPSCFAVHKWYAICISDVGDYEGIKKKIANAYVIKEHFQKAIELNSKDATSLHLMGIWCYTFAEMPWYQSKIASVLFSTPPSSTYEEALRYFQMAEDVEPNFYSKNLLFLGKTYMKLNNRKLALLWLTKAKERLAHTEEDTQVQKEAVELLNSV